MDSFYSDIEYPPCKGFDVRRTYQGLKSPCWDGIEVWRVKFQIKCSPHHYVAVVAEWYRYRIVACFVTSSSPVPLKTRRLGQRCTLILSKTETSSRWCGVVVRRGGASSGVVHVT
ncbi:uncharacterized protein TNCV_2681971 [Trichonephila clavipes]|nr:uncharacterized protein TNCV_2681971 [Trichonephila clavipes]